MTLGRVATIFAAIILLSLSTDAEAIEALPGGLFGVALDSAISQYQSISPAEGQKSILAVSPQWSQEIDPPQPNAMFTRYVATFNPKIGLICGVTATALMDSDECAQEIDGLGDILKKKYPAAYYLAVSNGVGFGMGDVVPCGMLSPLSATCHDFGDQRLLTIHLVDETARQVEQRENKGAG